jgi:hypothetical protein
MFFFRDCDIFLDLKQNIELRLVSRIINPVFWSRHQKPEISLVYFPRSVKYCDTYIQYSEFNIVTLGTSLGCIMHACMTGSMQGEVSNNDDWLRHTCFTLVIVTSKVVIRDTLWS